MKGTVFPPRRADKQIYNWRTSPLQKALTYKSCALNGFARMIAPNSPHRLDCPNDSADPPPGIGIAIRAPTNFKNEQYAHP